MATDHHVHEVSRRCRVCGHKTSSVSVPVLKLVDYLLVVFGIDVRTDIADVHPKRLCGSCYSVVKRFGQETESGKPRETAIAVVAWHACSGGKACRSYDGRRAEGKGGYAKRPKGKRGRPPADTQLRWKGNAPAMSASLEEPEGKEASSVRICLSTGVQSLKAGASLDPERFIVPVQEKIRLHLPN